MKKFGKVVLGLGLAGVLGVSGVSMNSVVSINKSIEATKYEASSSLKVKVEKSKVAFKQGNDANLGFKWKQGLKVTVYDENGNKTNDLDLFTTPDGYYHANNSAPKGTYKVKLKDSKGNNVGMYKGEVIKYITVVVK